METGQESLADPLLSTRGLAWLHSPAAPAASAGASPSLAFLAQMGKTRGEQQEGLARAAARFLFSSHPPFFLQPIFSGISYTRNHGAHRQPCCPGNLLTVTRLCRQAARHTCPGVFSSGLCPFILGLALLTCTSWARLQPLLCCFPLPGLEMRGVQQRRTPLYCPPLSSPPHFLSLSKSWQ